MTSVTKINGKIITNYHSELVGGIEAEAMVCGLR